MPMRAPRICTCGRRVSGGAQCVCQTARKAEADKRRPSARARGYTTKWERESKAFLARPENQRCACGCGRLADMVDHRVPHRGDQRLFWSRSNWQPMASSPCHSSRKQSEEKRSRTGPARDPRGVSQTLPYPRGTGSGVEFSEPQYNVSGNFQP